MLSRLAIAGAVGATMFALAGAGAAALATGSGNGIVQQTNAMTATCLNPATTKYGPLQYQTHVNNQDVTYENVSQQNVEPYCGGQFIQFTLKMDNGALVYSNKVLIPTPNITSISQLGSGPLPGYQLPGLDLQTYFPNGVCAYNVTSTVATIANTIDSPGDQNNGAVVGTLPTCANDGFFNSPTTTASGDGGHGGAGSINWDTTKNDPS